ncbi:glycosyltransferase [Paenibacillus antri]|uniref:Glycosyltransferase n=1 Tax=Paenibacillus antri TaxID=2582848 RepID=A0A5R9GA04_9BACL|nr:glycosyltransferase family 2 protein [Paenibacillus antri]TLS50208.1 glycosyltransferase [Paenibacillus antri]
MFEVLVAFALCLIWGLVYVRTTLGLPTIRDVPSGLPLPAQPPLVSVVIAAKEEQENIQETIRHLMRQTYGRLEIIAVNDRSSDATGARMDALKAWSDKRPEQGPALRVIHITQLPQGWLGKNHALYQGYLQARGTYLLFTDADVRFEPNAIRDAVAYALQQGADHVTLLPKLEARTFWLRAFVHYFLFSLCLLVPPWKGNDDTQRKYGIGVGAFNLLRREAYEGIGTHKALSMRPDDDLRLGMLVKRGGWKQRVMAGAKRIAVEWYPTLSDAVNGLEKNLYSGFGYRLPMALAAMFGQLLLFAVPLTAPLWSRGPALVLFLLADAFLVLAYLRHVRKFNDERGLEAVALPASVFMLVWVLVRSVGLAHARKGVYWRGTFYSLEELRRMFQ